VRPFDYSALMSAGDVHGELAKVVEDLATWLSVVESGLSGILGAVGGVNGQGFGPAKDGPVLEERVEGDQSVIDDLYEFEVVDDDVD